MRLIRVVVCRLFHRRHWETIPWQSLPRRVRKHSKQIAIVVRCSYCEEWWIKR
jgi:hypothetical protein